jgi:DNA (cytosine-5)-methyltransferase 1
LSTSEQFEWDWHHIQTTYKDFKKGELHDSLNDMDFTDVDQNHKWQKGGIAWNGLYMDCLVSPTPSTIIKSSLLDLIEKDDVSSMYYLSPNAAEGILRRVDNQGRTLFSPLRIALEKLKDNK